MQAQAANKIHRVLINGVAQNLELIFNEKQKADKVLERCFKANKQWGKRDRSFIANATYEIVRWYRNYCHILTLDYTTTRTSKECYALVDWYLILTKQLDHEKIFDKKEFNAIQKRAKEATENLALQQSYPNWIVESGIAETELIALNKTATLVVRVNTLKTSNYKLEQQLNAENIKFEKVNNPHFAPLQNAYVLPARPNIFAGEAFKNGLLEVQDAGSQMIAYYLDVNEGMRVIDACAGAGGKTLMIAALMQNKGKIISLDTEAHKLEELKKRAKRNGVTIVETHVIDSSKTIKRLHNTADRLLLDVPCSGLGVLRRNPDAKWKINPEFIHTIRTVQQNILSNYTAMLKVGGVAVYATCSLLPLENEEQVSAFLTNNKDYELLKQQYILPSMGFDGFYMAAIKRLK
jgi:16S rRNA (cytosine967-C5)-methyltransferase